MTHIRWQSRLALASLLLISVAGCSAGLQFTASDSVGSGASGGSGSGGSSGSGSGGSGSGGSSGPGSSSGAASTIALSTLTANNTAACPASAPLPAYCVNVFAGQVDSRSNVATPMYDAPASNISTEDPHGYLTSGSNTKIYANMMLGYCVDPASTHCDNNVQTGYNSVDANAIAAQAQDMENRHIDGAIMTWEGDGTSEDAATLLYQKYIDENNCSAQGCSMMYLIMYDGPSWAYSVASTGIPGTTGASCSGLTGTGFENCVVAHMRNDMCYMNAAHWGNSAYLKSNGRPIVQVFPDEEVIPQTGPAPSWADAWAQVENWNNDLPGNCGEAPYNADNGVPMIVFENNGGFAHQASSGSYYWIEPAGSDFVDNQFALSISPASQAGTLDNFLGTALSYSNELTWSNAFKGFNSSQSTWGTGRIMDQECGQTWIGSFTASNQYYSGAVLPYMQIATWNDYNEGTEIESGIDNCYAVNASTLGQTLSWTLSASNTYASLTTVSHIEVYDSSDGENLALVASLPAAVTGSWSLSNLPSGAHTLFVRMVGKNSIQNRISGGIAYSN